MGTDFRQVRLSVLTSAGFTGSRARKKQEGGERDGEGTGAGGTLEAEVERQPRKAGRRRLYRTTEEGGDKTQQERWERAGEPATSPEGLGSRRNGTVYTIHFVT
ncbi:hypothetical protein NDU88_004951 [Pleurodeles waltl]|uniref:Uncharacterized protein n=1 Tax=Pleurodeles waltl TaxID=8319 RepID=A0AAV7M7S9_PLEWA|nr:hypothetical protein NDU88_004951 [Pleurodeles waltl]